MSKCPICGSEGDDLVFRFYCSNKDCANFVPPKINQSEEEYPVPEVCSLLFTKARIWAEEKMLEEMTLPKGEVFSFSKPEFLGPFSSQPFAKELQAEWLDTDRDLEVMKEHIYAGLGVPREFLEPGCGSRPRKDFPHFKLVLSPFDNSLMLYWYDQVPAVLNTLIHPILENKVGTPMTRRLEGTTQHQIIERLLDMVCKGQLVRNEARYCWELHFTE